VDAPTHPDDRVNFEAARASAGWLLVLGVVQILIGLLALLMIGVATFAAMILLGILALAGGIMEIINAFTARRGEHGIMHFLVGILYVAFGILVLANPGVAAVTLTLILAVMLVAGGIIRMVLAAVIRPSGWGWSLLSGAISVLLGVLIGAGWPGTGLWVIGLFVGIDLIFMGWTWVALALAVRGMGSRREYTRDVPPPVPAG